MTILTFSCGVLNAIIYVNIGIQILHNQIECSHTLLTVNKFINAIYVFDYDRLKTVLLAIWNFVDVFKEMFNFVFSPAIASLICLYCEFTCYFANNFRD